MRPTPHPADLCGEPAPALSGSLQANENLGVCSPTDDGDFEERLSRAVGRQGADVEPTLHQPDQPEEPSLDLGANIT